MAADEKLSENVDDFNRAIDTFLKLAKHKGIGPDESQIRQLYESVMQQYAKYAGAHPILVTNFDPLKVFAWAPFELIRIMGIDPKSSASNAVFTCSANCMCDFLYRSSGAYMDAPWITKMIVIAKASFDGSLESVSIAKIGFYAAFRSTRQTSLVRGLAPQERFSPA